MLWERRINKDLFFLSLSLSLLWQRTQPSLSGTVVLNTARFDAISLDIIDRIGYYNRNTWLRCHCT